MSDNLKEQIAAIVADIYESADNGGGGYDADREWADKILAIPEIAEALKMKPIQTMKVRG